MTQIAVTGAHGFVGRHLVAGLGARGFAVRALVRRPGALAAPATTHVVGDLRDPRDLDAALAGTDVVVHAAGLAHAGPGHDEVAMDAINRSATTALARRATALGARRFVFISSVRAQSGPSAEGVVDEDRTPTPIDAYGRSKLAAERELAQLDLDWAALRPVLVYGEGVGGNMATLLRLARSPLPLPFAAIRAPRSLLAVENLVDAVATLAAARHRLAGPFLVADETPMNLGQMIAALRRGLGRGPGLLPVPPSLLAVALRALGRGDDLDRLTASLVVDCSALRRQGWLPRITSEAGLTALARASHLPADRPARGPTA